MYKEECLQEIEQHGCDMGFLEQPEINPVDESNVKSFKQENLLGFLYADIGGMGSVGCVKFAYKEKELKFYSLDIYKHKDLFAILRQDLFRNMSESDDPDTFVRMSNNQDWKCIQLQFANKCFIKAKYQRNLLVLCRYVGENVQPNSILLAMQLLLDDKYKNAKKYLLKKHYSNFLGAIAGDIVGSIYEFHPINTKGFPLFSWKNNFDENGQPTIASQLVTHFTDDTVMTLAVCKSLLDCKGDYTNLRQITINNMKELGRKYPHAGYGLNFKQWLKSNDSQPYNSFGNGSAMRISAVPYFANNRNELKELTKKVTDITHNHPEGLKGADVIAYAMWLIFQGHSKSSLKNILQQFYTLDFDFEDLKAHYGFDETCQGSVPQSIFAFLISNSYEDAIKNAIVMGGDADTMACIAGALAGAYYGVPQYIKDKVKYFLSPELLKIYNDYEETMCKGE